MDDLLAWCLLAVVITVAGGGSDVSLIVFGPVYLAAMLWVVRPSSRMSSGSRRARTHEVEGRFLRGSSISVDVRRVRPTVAS